MAKRLLCVVLSLLMIMAVLPMGVVADTPEGDALTSTGGTLSSGSYYLSENTTLTTDITIASGATVTLDLNGYTLTGSGSASVITVNSGGTFTLKDSSSSGTGSDSRYDADTNANEYTVTTGTLDTTSEVSLIAVEEEIEEDSLLYGRSLSLGGKIGVNYYFDFTDVLEADSTVDPTKYYVVFSVGGTERDTVNLSSKSGYYVATCRVYFYEMSQNITAVLYDGSGNEVETIDNYTVATYYTLLDDSDSEELKNLVVAMLHYGGYGQTWANKYTGSLADSGLESMAAVTDLSDYAYTTGNGSENLSIAPTLVLDDTCALKFEITATGVTISSVTLDGIDVTANLITTDESGVSYILIDDILVQNWDVTHTIVVTDSNGHSDTISDYSVLSYAYYVLNDTTGKYSNDTNLVNLVKSMYLYNVAADAYLS